MFKRILSVILVAMILVATGSGCYAGTRYSGRRGYGHSGYRSRDYDPARSIIAVGAVLGGLMVIDAVVNSGRQQALYQGGYYPQGIYVPQECAQFVGNDRALNACISGVAQRQAQDQQQLERDAYRAGYGR